jgi:tetratricopeptide (TPR) repeat protein
MGVLAPAQLVERLERRFELLVGTTRDTSARQTSMRAALDWSWDLLPTLERAVFAQIAVFRGAFSIEAAESVVDLSEAVLQEKQPGSTVLDALESLKQRSLVFTVAEGTRTLFNLYDGVRDYAHEKLDAIGFRQATSLRHAEYFVQHFEGRPPTSDAGPVRELEDLLAAARFCFKASLNLARRAVLAAVPWLQGRPGALRQLLDQSLQNADAVDLVVAKLCVARADFLRMRGETERAEEDAQRAITLARALRDRSVEGQAVALRGYTEHGKGNFDAAEKLYAQALEIAQAIGDKRLEAHTLGNWALTERLRRHVPEALDLAERALALHRAHGDLRQATGMLTVLGTLHHFRDQTDRARRSYEEALAYAQKSGDQAREAVVLGNLGNLKQETGDLEGARVDIERAIEILHRLGLRRIEGMGLGNLGSLFFEMGRLADARESYERAITLFSSVGDVVHEALFSAHLGGALATMDDVTEAESRVARAEELLLPMMGEDHLAKAASLHRGHVELAQARLAEIDGDHQRAEQLRQTVRTRIDEAKSLASPGDDVRFTLRMLARALERPSDPDSIAMRGSLTVTTDASNVRSPRGESFSLEKRRAVRLVLKRLVAARLESPATPLTVDDLLAAGWPGERVLRDAGASRVYVALGTLRKLGLRDVIVSRDGGYYLDPRVEVLVVSRL